MGQGTTHFERVIWIVLDSVGIGELPDAADYGDVGRDTLGHIARSRPLHLPNLVRLGLASIKPLATSHSARAPNRKLRQRRHTLTRKRYDHWSLGNGRHLARPGLPGLSARFSARAHRRI